MANWLLNKVGLGTDIKDTFAFTVGERVGEVGLWDLHAGEARLGPLGLELTRGCRDAQERQRGGEHSHL
jgi:hypothetical protein